MNDNSIFNDKSDMYKTLMSNKELVSSKESLLATLGITLGIALYLFMGYYLIKLGIKSDEERQKLRDHLIRMLRPHIPKFKKAYSNYGELTNEFNKKILPALLVLQFFDGYQLDLLPQLMYDQDDFIEILIDDLISAISGNDYYVRYGEFPGFLEVSIPCAYLDLNDKLLKDENGNIDILKLEMIELGVKSVVDKIENKNSKITISDFSPYTNQVTFYVTIKVDITLNEIKSMSKMLDSAAIDKVFKNNKAAKESLQNDTLSLIINKYSKHFDALRKEYIQNVANASKIINVIAKKAFGNYLDKFNSTNEEILTQNFNNAIKKGLNEILNNGRYKNVYNYDGKFATNDIPLSFTIKPLNNNNQDVFDTMSRNAENIPVSKLNSKHIEWGDTLSDNNLFEYSVNIISDIDIKEIMSFNKQSNEYFNLTLPEKFISKQLNKQSLTSGNEFFLEAIGFALITPFVLGIIAMFGAGIKDKIDNHIAKKILEKIKPYLEPYLKTINDSYNEYVKFTKSICPKMINEYKQLPHVNNVEGPNVISRSTFIKKCLSIMSHALRKKQTNTDNTLFFNDYDFMTVDVDKEFANSEMNNDDPEDFYTIVEKIAAITNKYKTNTCNVYAFTDIDDYFGVPIEIDIHFGITYKDLQKLADIVNNNAKQIVKSNESLQLDIFHKKEIIPAYEGIGTIALVIGAVLAGGTYLKSVIDKAAKNKRESELVRKIQDRFNRYAKHIEIVRKEYLQNVSNAEKIIIPNAKQALGNLLDRINWYSRNVLISEFNDEVMSGIRSLLVTKKYDSVYSYNGNFRIAQTPFGCALNDYDYDEDSERIDKAYDDACNLPFNKLNSKHVKWNEDPDSDYEYIGFDCDIIFDIKVTDLIKDIVTTDQEIKQSNESFNFTLDIPNYIIYNDTLEYGREGLIDSLSDKLVNSYAKKHEDKNPQDKEFVAKSMTPILKPFIKKSLNGYKAYTQFVKSELSKQLNVLKGQVVRIIPGSLQKDTYINAVMSTLYKSITNDKASEQYFDTGNKFQNKYFNNVLHVSTGNHLKSRDNPNAGSGGTTIVVLKDEFNNKNYPDFGIKSANERYIMPTIQFKKVDNKQMLMINCNINTEITSENAKQIVNAFKQVYNSAKKSKLKELQAEQMGSTENLFIFNGLNDKSFN